MDVQTPVVALVVLAAAAFVINRCRCALLGASLPTGNGKRCSGCRRSR